MALFFEQAPAPICVLAGPDFVYELINPAYQQLFPNRLLLGLPLLEALPELVGQALPLQLRDVYTTGLSFEECEIRLPLTRLPGGVSEDGYFNFIYQARYSSAGLIDGILVIGSEVTEQVLIRQRANALQAEMLVAAQQLAAQRESFYQVFEQTPALICILSGPEYRMDYHNPAFGQLYAGRELLGRTVAETQPEAVAQGFVALLDQIYNTGETYQAAEVLGMVQSPAGGPLQERYFDFTYQPFQRNGQTIGISVFAFEVTEQVLARKEAEQSQTQLNISALDLGVANVELVAINQELLAANGEVRTVNRELDDTNHQLARTNAELDTFVYTASHDLRAPISNIEGLLSAVGDALPADHPITAAVEPLLAMMQSAVTRFQRTLGHLTDIAHLEQNMAQPPEAVDMTAVIADVQLDLAPLVKAAGAQLTVNVSDCPTHSFSPKNLRSIIYNLLSNAIKYRDPARVLSVLIQCQSVGTNTMLSVTDNGLGLSSEQIPQLFGLFRRLHDHVEGSGVGLYMIKKIVENAGGTIQVQSEAGIGSTFTVLLPQ
ncbi:sensor histidine kinase [Hymenobacter roseosalivarius]|uniref:sensor histidine kinase n=1 Tax=Hymenobacter roseosalivarius TaxID=89967 RepID=UPI0013564EB6|nr:PAS domain-containing sensor histidine kinase [Hymenobacter roseosalivarius]